MGHTKITKIAARFDHMNIDVSNLERSIEFYDKALGLKEVGHRIEAPDGSFIIVYLGEQKEENVVECEIENGDGNGNVGEIENGDVSEIENGDGSGIENGDVSGIENGNVGEIEKENSGRKRENVYSSFRLELTWLRTHANKPYELGENETHLCVRVPGDYDKTREYHRAMGCICYENESMGLYFIHDPDDYWIEVLPLK